MIQYLVLLFFLPTIFCLCPTFQTKRTCECKITYSIGNEPPYNKKLFDLPSYDDCGYNIGCDNLDCAIKCLNSVRRVLGGREEIVTNSAKERVCQLISPYSPLSSGIKVWASWKYDTCRSGNEPIIQDVCCNRKCNCNLIGQKAIEMNQAFIGLKQFKDLVPSSQISYDCNLDEVYACKKDCVYELSNYFNNPKIRDIVDNRKILNLNIFGDDYASTRVCSTINESILKPGMDVYAEVDAGQGFNNSYVSLGRVCCKRKCKCEYVFKDGFFGNNSKPALEILPTDSLNLGYECSNELSDCMSFCRKQAFQLINPIEQYNQNKTTVDLDVFRINEYKRYICRLIDRSPLGDTIGTNMYLRYSTNNEYFPFQEDIHIGRICCIRTLSQYVGLNRCDQTDAK